MGLEAWFVVSFEPSEANAWPKWEDRKGQFRVCALGGSCSDRACASAAHKVGTVPSASGPVVRFRTLVPFCFSGTAGSSLLPEHCQQRVDLAAVQFAGAADFGAAKFDRADCDADQPFDFAADGLGHAADLAVAAFGDADAED